MFLSVVLLTAAATGALAAGALKPRASGTPLDYYLPPFFCPKVPGVTNTGSDYYEPLGTEYDILYCDYSDWRRCYFDLVRVLFLVLRLSDD